MSRRPLLVERVGDVPHAGLVAAAVADQDDVREAVRLVAAADVGEQRVERRRLEADRARIASCGRSASARCAPSGTNFTIGAMSEFGIARAMYGSTVCEHEVVLAAGDVRAVLLDAAGADDDRRRAGLHETRAISIHVSSSAHRLSPASIGRGASPPAVPCAPAVVAIVKRASRMVRDVFMTASGSS